MPSDLREAKPDAQTVIEPPSMKLMVRLFVIPFMIVAIAVGTIYLISLLAGREPTVDEAIAGLKGAGGARTADYLVGPGSKQRYLYAKALTDRMKMGMALSERVKLTDQLIDLLDHYTHADEGEVQHFLLLALGRAWQVDPRHANEDSAEAMTARQRAAAELVKYAQSQDIGARKAALLAMVYFKGHDQEQKQFLPMLSKTVRDGSEDLDVRLSAATALGPLASADDRDAIDALHVGLHDTDDKDRELVWQCALSLAELNQPDVADTILMLLNRADLGAIQVYDRETDPKNPRFRNLSEAEQERILINTMIGVEHYNVPAVQDQLKKIAAADPSARVRMALQANSAKDAASE